MQYKTHNKLTAIVFLVGILSGCMPEDDDIQTKNSMAHLADKLNERGDHKNALQFYEKAINEDPSNLDLKIKYAKILNALRLYPDARRELRNVLKLDPTLVAAKVELAKTYLNENKPNDALKLLDDIKSGNSVDASILSLCGVAHDMNGNHQTAQDYYTQSMGLDSNNNHLQANYGLSLVLSGQVDQGIKILEELSKLATASAKDRQNLAVAYALNGNIEKARKLLSIDLKPEEVDSTIKFLKLRR